MCTRRRAFALRIQCLSRKHRKKEKECFRFRITRSERMCIWSACDDSNYSASLASTQERRGFSYANVCTCICTYVLSLLSACVFRLCDVNRCLAIHALNEPRPATFSVQATGRYAKFKIKHGTTSFVGTKDSEMLVYIINVNFRYSWRKNVSYLSISLTQVVKNP